MSTLPFPLDPKTVLENFLHETEGRIRIGCDTEFAGPQTLTQQFAVRRGETIDVVLRHDPGVVAWSMDGDITHLLPPKIGDYCQRVRLVYQDVIRSDYRPRQLLIDLFGLPLEANGISLGEIQKIPPLSLTLVGHQLSADILRIFGAQYYSERLNATPPDLPPLQIIEQRRVRFQGRDGGAYQLPVCDTLRGTHFELPIRIDTFDTNLPFDKAKLDQLAADVLNIRKGGSFDASDLADMMQTFRTKPDVAYRYAVLDAILARMIHDSPPPLFRSPGPPPLNPVIASAYCRGAMPRIPSTLKGTLVQ